MLKTILPASILASTSSVTMDEFLVCTAVSLVLGVIIALLHTFRNLSYTRNFIITLAVIPVIVETIIMVVDGNFGTGIAVAGAFGLIRFRSQPGTSRELASIFLAMAVGLANGMGYLSIAAILTLVVEALIFILLLVPTPGAGKRHLKVTIPENLDYNGIFDDIFAKYTTRAELNKVRTVNLGSLYELDYQIVLKDPSKEKQMLDEIRCRNGNLTLICGKNTETGNEL